MTRVSVVDREADSLGRVPVRFDSSLEGIDWETTKADLEHVPGQHVGLQTDDAQALYASLGFKPPPEFLLLVVGRRLDNEANRA